MLGLASSIFVPSKFNLIEVVCTHLLQLRIFGKFCEFFVELNTTPHYENKQQTNKQKITKRMPVEIRSVLNRYDQEINADCFLLNDPPGML